jgi:hypothetical protein
MTGGWGLAALAIMAVVSVAHGLFALWRHRRWLDSIEHLVKVTDPGCRIVCRNADGAVIKITPEAETARSDQVESAGADSAKVSGRDVPC